MNPATWSARSVIGDEFGLAENEKSSCQHYVTVDGGYLTLFDNNNRDKQTRITSYAVNTADKKAEAARFYYIPGPLLLHSRQIFPGLRLRPAPARRFICNRLGLGYKG